MSITKFANSSYGKEKMTINERIFFEIEQQKLKQSDLARLLNVRTSVITTWKTRGTNPPAEYLAQICEFLNITIPDLFEIPDSNLSENQKEMLIQFNKLPEREQIKWIGKLEEAAKEYTENKSQDINTQSKIS